jgi:hypothetical protein
VAHHIAELNIGRIRYDVDDPRMAGFMDNLDQINALAERSKGFVWRYQDASGSAIDTKRDNDPRELLNISVWETAEDLERYVFGTLHARFYARRHDWFEAPKGPHFVMWPTPVGHRPSIDEALERLAVLARSGPTEQAYGWEALPNAQLWMEKRCA